MSGGGGSGNQITRVEPARYQLPYLESGLARAEGLFGQGGPQQYGGNTVVPFASQTEDALAGTEARARAGSPVIGAAQDFVQQGLSGTPSSNLGASTNPYAASAYAQGAPNPFTGSAFSQSGANPFAGSAYSGPSGNPYADSANPFGGATNPMLDAVFNQAAQRSRNTLESEFARAGRNVSAAAPARADMLTDLAAKIYAPAYESERNRQLQYQSQLTGIGAQGFESAQGRQLQAALQGQQLGSQGFENLQSRQLQAALQGQQLGAQGFESAEQRQLQAALQGQQIGGQGFENAQSRQLQDLQSQRAQQLGLLGYASPLAAQDYADLAALRGVGGEVEGQAGRFIDDARARFDYEQIRPEDALNQYLARVRGTDYGTQQVTPQYRNRAAGAAGGALAGGQLGAALAGTEAGSFLGPYGALIGAIGGGIFGYQ